MEMTRFVSELQIWGQPPLCLVWARCHGVHAIKPRPNDILNSVCSFRDSACKAEEGTNCFSCHESIHDQSAFKGFHPTSTSEGHCTVWQRSLGRLSIPPLSQLVTSPDNKPFYERK